MSPRRSSLSPRASRPSTKRAARRGGRAFARVSILRQEQLEDRSLLSVDLLGSFAGMTIDSNTGGTFFTPPDSCGAASSGATYVETVNQQVTIYNKTTGAPTATDNFNHFFITTGGLPHADATSSLFDTSITYDDQIGRFIVSDMDYDFGSGHVSRFDFAVSTSADPATLTTADWNFYQIDTSENDGTASGTFDADFPGNLGWNHDAFVVTLNMFAVDGSSAHVQVNSVSIADLVNGVSQANLHVYRNDASDELNLRPAVMHDAKAGDPMWFVDQASKDHIQVFKMTNVLSSSATFVGTQLPVNSYNDIHQSGVYPKQPNGTTVTTNQDSRIQKVAVANNLLVASQAINVSPTQNDARWYEIDVSGTTPVLKQQGDVSGGDNTYVYYPAVDINSSGDIGMTYMQSGTDTSTDFMSMWVTGRAPTDAAGTMETPVLAQAGVANYTDQNSGGPQAGDFSGISTDADGSFFAASEYATTRASGNWGTEIAHFSIAAPVQPPSVVYVNAAWSAFSQGQAIADADPVTPGNQAAAFGTTAFATVGAALAAVAPGGTIYVNSGDYSTEAVSIASNDTLAVLGTAPGTPGTVTFGSLAGAAGTTVDTGSVGSLDNALREGGLGTATTDAGLISGPGNLMIVGGSLTLSDNLNSYAGGTKVTGGTLLVDGAAGSGAVVVGSGATLGGTGSIAGALTVSAGGTVSPGDPTSSASTLATGSLTLLGTYAAQIDGATTPGANYDQLKVTGTSTLTGGSLTLTLGYAPSAGDSIVLVSGSGAVAGPVAINGAVVNEGGHLALSFGSVSYDFKASYAGDKLTLTLDQSPTINVDSYSTGLNNTIDLSTSGGNTIVAVNGSTVFEAPTAALTGLTLNSASDNDTFNVHSLGVATTINGGTGSDAFNVTGPLTAALTIAGGTPAAGGGDLLQFNAGSHGVTVSATTITQSGAGTLTYSGIANLRITNDGGVTLNGSDNAANAVIISRDLADNTLDDITLDGGPTIAMSTASSLDYSGGGGTASNQVTINEDANGQPVLKGTAAGTHVNTAFTASSPNPANVGINFSGGGSGANTLAFNFTASHDVAVDSDNAAADSGIGAVAGGLNVSYDGLTSLALHGSGGTLTLSDAANPTVTSLTLSDPTLGSGQTLVSGNGAWAAVTLDGFGSLSVQGNNANNNTITLSGADAAAVNGHALANVTLQGGPGNDTISVESLSAGITATLLGGDGANQFNLDGAGGTHDPSKIAGSLDISPVGDSTNAIDTLNIDDSGHQGQRTVTVTQNTIVGITDSGTSPIDYDGSGRIQTIHIAGGNAGNEFDIQGTNRGVLYGYTIDTGGGADTVNISSDAPANTGTLTQIQAPVFLNTQGGGDSLNVSDRGSASATYTLAAGGTPLSTMLTTSDSATITYDANGGPGQLAHFNLTGAGGGNDRFSVNLASLGTATTLSVSANSLAGGNTLAVTADAGVADALTVTPSAPDAGTVSDTRIAGGTALGSVVYSGINDIELTGQAADGDIANVVGMAGKDTTVDLGAQTVTQTGFAPVSLSAFGTVNVAAAGAAVDLLDKATDDNVTITLTGSTSGTAQAASTALIVNFSAASHVDVDLSGGGKVMVKSSNAASTLVADEPDRTIFVTASDGTKLLPVVLSPDVTTVELDGGTGKTTFVVVPAPGLLPPGTTDVVGKPNFQAPANLVVGVVGAGPAGSSTLAVANYDPATGKLSPLASSVFAIVDSTSATSGALHMFRNNGPASGPSQYPDIDYTDVGKVDIDSHVLLGHLTTQEVVDWIVQLYVQILGREPSVNEVTFWLNLFESGVPAENVAIGFIRSAEHRANQINKLYEKYLGRKADSDGLTYWSGVWNATGGPEQVEAGIIGSAEFYANAARTYPKLLPNAAWITVLYQDLLGRDPDPQGLLAWVNLQNHSRQTVVLSFVTSDEYRLDQINDVFQTYLDRPVDTATAPAILQAIQQGLTQDQVLGFVLSSDEYMSKAT